MPDGIRALVFDLDGTLVETAADLHLVLAEVLATAGHEAPSLPAVRAMIGDGARVLIERALAALGAPADPPAVDRLFDRFRDRYAEVPCRLSEPYPFAAELLAAAAGSRVSARAVHQQATRGDRPACCGRWVSMDCSTRSSAATPARHPQAAPGHLAAVLERSGGTTAGGGHDRRQRQRFAHGACAGGSPASWSASAIRDVPARELGADIVVDRLDAVPAALATLRASAAH